MKILYHFRTQGTGAEGVHIAGIARAFEELGHEVIFSSPSGVDPRTSAGANPFDGARKRSWLARLAAHAPSFLFELLEMNYNAVWHRRLRKLLAREAFDLIYERHAFFLYATAWLAHRRRIPLVVEVNELVGDERVRAKPWFAPLARLADRATFQCARRIVVVSPHLRRKIVEMGIPEEKILVLPNAVSEEAVTAPDGGAPIRARYRCEGALVIGFVGWFVAWHRLDRLLEETAKLPGATLMLVGEGPLAGALAEQAAALGMAERVIFTGAVAHAEISAHIDAMDICVVPHSNAYRSPIKLFEYMARGRAIVAPRTEPIASVIRHGENGLLFDPEAAGDLGRQLAILRSDGPLRQRIGEQARADVIAHHTWMRNAEAVLAGLTVGRDA